MRAFATRLLLPLRSPRFAPLPLAAGLAMLIAQLSGIPSPVVTAMSLVALGATLATITRSREHPAARVMLAPHLCVYASLYLLFIGAICDVAFRGPQVGLTALEWTDFGLSAAVMAVVAQTCVAHFIGSRDA